MPLPKNEAWFPAKTYGWGWSLPRRWQGWVVTIIFFAAVLAGTPLIKKNPLYYVGYSLALTLAMIGIAYWKGEKPHWSWGEKKEPR